MNMKKLSRDFVDLTDTVKDLSERLAMVEGRMDWAEQLADNDARLKVLETKAEDRIRNGLKAKSEKSTEPAIDRAHRGLAEATAKLPHYAEHLTKEQVAERAAKKESDA